MRFNASAMLFGPGRLVCLGWLASFGFGAAGCARGPNVASDLPLRRVVVYRNGVGYFERAGKVDKEEVRFRMRGRMVGDFLATLAIVEQGGGTVRSASFPIDVKDQNGAPPPPVPTEDQSMLKPWPEPKPDKNDPNKLRDVVLSLDGSEHNLSIGYVAETPVWRPSYRVVVGDGGYADLQTWGIVQNLSGEDWSNVDLVLVAGAPIAFQSTLGTPVVPERPVVNDSGEVIAAVPTGETTLSNQPAEAPPPAPATPAPEGQAAEMEEAEPPASKDEDRLRKKAASFGAARDAAKPAPKAAAPGGGAGASMQAANAPSLSAPRRVSALAAVALEAGTTRYTLPERVNVPDESATMVLLLHQRVPGAAVFLFSPDPGVPDSSSHPFRVVRFTNASTGLLERGPIAVFEKGSFLGEGVLEPLPPKATATVPFALERGLAVQSESRFDELGARILKIEASQLWIERDQVHKTTYKVQNGGADAAHVLVKHPRTPGARLFQPPPGTEDNVGTGSALVPIDVKPYGKAELVVDERSPYQEPIGWLDDLAALAVKAYLTDPRSDQKVVAQLGPAWAVRDKLRALADERNSLSTEQADLQRNTQETRASLKAIEKNKAASDLVAKLTERLRRDTDRLDAITKRLIEIDLANREQEVRFRDAIRDIDLVAPPPLKD
ncbi:MAG TPA: hypothetical protein VHC69_28755 [Polyangiaceae bacterium]|nr:hypothetical protein [Polyangiaceae bacterium]